MEFLEVLSQWELPLLLGAFVGMALLGLGYFWRNSKAHLLRIGGWVLFGIYWPTQAFHFFFESDPVNAYFSLAAPLFASYIAFHEYLSWKWREDPPALRWLAGTTFVAATTYFVIYKIPPVTTALIHLTAVETAWLLTALFGVQAAAAPSVFEPGTYDVLVDGKGYAVTIILACTAVQSIMIFVGAIWTLERSPPKKKALAYLITVPVIYFLNIFRNAGIVFGYRVWDFPPLVKGIWNATGGALTCALPWLFGGCFPIGEVGTQERFEFMHSVLGKGGSLIALVFIALGVFTLLPELHGHILDILDLRKRSRPGFFPEPSKPPSGAQPGGDP